MSTQSLRERNKELTRGAILTAAFLLIESKGVAGASMQEVAACAGVSDSTVFNYFKTKDDLVDSLVSTMTGTTSFAELVAARPASEAPVRAVRNLLKELAAASAEVVAPRQQIYRTARSDKALWGAFLRSNYVVAEDLAAVFQVRVPSWTPITASAVAHSVLACVEAAYAAEAAGGGNVTVASWAADVDELLARLEKAWRPAG